MRYREELCWVVDFASGMEEAAMGTQAPVEYAVAVEEYLGQASRRVYRVSLTGWAWPIVGKPIPSGADRRCAAPPT